MATGEGGQVLIEARAVVGDLDLVPLERAVQAAARKLGQPLSRSRDALRLASTLLLGDDLRAFVAFDRRFLDASKAAGLPAEPAVAHSPSVWGTMYKPKAITIRHKPVTTTR
ncbi:hypothetical protein K6U06_22785 [Acidiferrimicrobium sp. IK]|uniref:hypothetical protein n=1 Tax=Acidiferrimicrobium sp. IK TaxID=2871700 RepID=UPI0021CB4840|nr:hypothetical protein [Acidiferrimicrobium sp. IK]MCU4187207.1 hypothetical protein [Acidiferrimicrobium sp. IK]